MTILIDLSVAGVNTGPFNLYSDADGYTSAFATNITRQQLLDGYPAVVAAGTTNIKLQSLSDICPNDTILPVNATTSTTTTLNCSFIVNAQEITTTSTTTNAPTTFYWYQADVYGCPSTIASAYRVLDCNGIDYVILPKTYLGNPISFVVGDVIEYKLTGQTDTRCGTITNVNFSGIPMGLINYNGTRTCGDTIHCDIASFVYPNLCSESFDTEWVYSTRNDLTINKFYSYDDFTVGGNTSVKIKTAPTTTNPGAPSYEITVAGSGYLTCTCLGTAPD